MFVEFIFGVMGALFSPPLVLMYIILAVLAGLSYSKNKEVKFTTGMKIVVAIIIIFLLLGGALNVWMINYFLD
jgi:hypothetical protein